VTYSSSWWQGKGRIPLWNWCWSSWVRWWWEVGVVALLVGFAVWLRRSLVLLEDERLEEDALKYLVEWSNSSTNGRVH